MATIRPIAQLGHPVLRQLASPIQDFTDPELASLIEDLLETMESSGGVGIAAPQVFLPLRVIVVASRPNARYPQAPLMEPLVLVNPELVWASGQQEEGWEGCLSIPGIRGLVPRAVGVRVSYRTPEGESRGLDLEGFPARIFQHELDHLDGLVFLDRIENNRNLISDAEYLRQFT